ncbi:NAD dependent epimerase/dehydratase family protein [Penicillium frequentans]|uniref:NAD dependent epimerase/dehydratase family protein n=1 Tax=Penicillium frequentans TaxID=3151616 RepID=A0AAD6D0Y6_9EURO|nr:NAD dependent epimerase/dehydratase family protein [Penicillium glabrum]
MPNAPTLSGELPEPPEKAKLLLSNEIAPVEGDITDTTALSTFIIDNSINIVVDASSAYEAAGKILDGVINAATIRQGALAKDNMIGPKLGFVYTSGAWVHGSQKTRINDLAPVGSVLSQGKPATPVAWRPAHEQDILAARDKLDVAIMRPHTVYGRGSWIWSTWWGPLAQAAKLGSISPVQVAADRTACPGVVHVDDVAAGFHAAIDRIDGRLGTWPVFDLVTETLSVVEIMENVKTFLGVKALIEYTGAHENPFLEALSLVSKSDASRAKTVLGWNPKRTEFLLNLPIYLKAWQASQ